MEQELDLHSIDPQTLDPKQEEELLASLSEEELAEVAGGTYISGGHICGSSGYYDSYEEARYDFEVGTRVQVTRAPNSGPPGAPPSSAGQSRKKHSRG